MAIPTELKSDFLQLGTPTRKAGPAALVFDAEPIDSARVHSQWMDATNTFSHTGAGVRRRQPHGRRGYDARGWGENMLHRRGRGRHGQGRRVAAPD